MEFFIWGITAALAYLWFRLIVSFNVHWAVALVFAAFPVALVLFLGGWGLLLAAFATGTMYSRAS